jgi:Tol biopolymer transport system component/DNA-binding winged helix-turn-helix (wHTH) protein
MSQQNHYVYEFGPFHLDATKRVLLKQGEPLKLFPKEFDTLLALVERSGELLEKDELMRKVWQDSIVEESNLATNISHLRKLLGETREKHDYIVTVPGRGYRFVAGVTQAFDELIVRERARITIEESEETEVADSFSDASAGAAENGNGTKLTPISADSVVNAYPSLTQRPNATRSQTMAPITALKKMSKLQALLVAAAVVMVVAISAGLASRSWRRSAVVPFKNVTVKQLTSNSRATLATLSPDGKLFLYSSREAGNEGLWLGSVSGAEAVCLRPSADVTYRSISFSSDGNSVFYVAISEEYPGGALFRMPVLGGVPEKLRDNIHFQVAFAPDMNQFAYVRSNAENQTSSVVIAETFGRSERTLASRPSHLPFRSFSPSWSADGSKIAVAAPTDETGESYELFVVSVKDGQIRQLTDLNWFHIASTKWLPDMSGLVIVAKEKGVWDAFQLWSVSYPQGTANRILPDLDNYGSGLGLSSDGQSLVAVQEQMVTDIWVTNAADLAQSKQITFSSVGRREGWNNLYWTPDNKLIYGAIVRGSLTLWSMSPDGANQKQLTSGGYRDSYVSGTADGRYIVFESNRSGAYELWRARVDGTDLKQLTSGGHNREPHVSPDGTWVVYTSSRNGLSTLWRVSIDSGEPLQLADKPAAGAAISHDAKFIACAYKMEPNSKTQLAIIPADGGAPLKLFDLPRLANFSLGVRWTPDDKAVTYRDWSNGIWRQPLTGGNPERLKGLPEEKLYSYSWSPDGKQFAFVRGSEIRDVVLLQMK